MTRKTRTIIFLICLFLFILIAPAAVLYSQGYRIDFNPPAGGKRITQTGGLFLKTAPRQADVYLDGKLNKKTDFFFGSVLVENLLPKKYKVEVKKEGYYFWEKTLEIKEKEVTEAKNIVLFPQSINFNVLFSQVEQFWFSPDQKKIILLEEDKSSSPTELPQEAKVKKKTEPSLPPSSSKQDSVKEEEKLSWALKLYDLNKNIKSHLMSEEDISSKEARLINLNFSEDSKSIHLELELQEKIKYFTLAIDKTTPIIEDTIAYQKIRNNDIYHLDGLGNLFRNGEQITATPFPIKQEGEEDKSSSSPFVNTREIEYVLESFQGFIFLRESGDLYKFNPDLKIFENFFERINALKISQDNKKLAYFSDYEIWVLFLSDKNDPPQKRMGEKLFLTRLSEKINDVFWLNSDYLIFNTEDKIKISEIDDRDRLNIIDVFEIKKLPPNGSPVKMFWNQFDKKIYILSGGNLYGSNPLLP